MAGSTLGTLFTVTTWGESHGPALGAVVDGCPAGLPLCEEDIQRYLDRRKPGQGKFTTARREGDRAQILSGVFDGKTTGTPISILIKNEDQRSRDYSSIKDCCRPGHADYTFDRKYGIRDYRGGGRSSGRETAGRVAAGAVVLEEVPDNATAVGVPARIVRVNGQKVTHPSENLDQIHVADPLSQCLCQMQLETGRLEKRLEELEERCKEEDAS